VESLFGGVQVVEHGTDQGGLAHVLRDADPLGIGRARNGRVAAVSEADRRRVKGHEAETLVANRPATGAQARTVRPDSEPIEAQPVSCAVAFQHPAPRGHGQ
jgi:hypothetical protein